MHLLLTAQSFLLAQADPAGPLAGNGALGHGLIYTVLIGLIIGVIAKFLPRGAIRAAALSRC